MGALSLRAAALRKASTVSVLAIALMGSVTACSAINEQATTKIYNASDGVNANVGQLEIRNIMIVSKNQGAPGRVLGTLLNPTDSPALVTISFPSGEFAATVPAKQELRLEDPKNAHILPSMAKIPGSVEEVPVEVKIAGNSSTNPKLPVPILNGSLREYAPYVPDATPTASPTPSLESTLDAVPTPTETDPAAEVTNP